MNTRLETPVGTPVTDSGRAAPVAEERPRTATYSYRGVAVVWLVGGVVATVIAIRFVLELLAANQGAAFTSFIYSLTAPLVAPFQGIFATPSRHGYVFDGAALVAVAIYLLATLGIGALVRLISTSRGARTPVD